ncbi:uncharacterized protein PpBr36_10949 [Pyricularia pennisetigena]|nr:uncharacterized protein PpBr36_10949 [Pyricularia pennisetigena]TLS20784.1 hypothetical protein PpBr36_10949 [Pyricularia pennisetigena]
MVVSLLRAETLPSARIVPRHKPIVILVLKPFPSYRKTILASAAR